MNNKILTAVLSLVCVSYGHASVTAYESFNYPTGTFANGTAATSSGFTGNWVVGGAAAITDGLTYPSLPSENNAFSQSPGGQRDSVSLASPLSGGTVYISFVYDQVGNNGGNDNGIYFPGSGATSLFVGITAPYSGTAGSLGLGSVTTASATATGAALLSGATQLTGGFNYDTTNLIVLRIDFNTSGANDTVSLWLNPPAGTNDPGVAADLVYSAYDVGTISGIGFNFQGGGQNNIFDELRVGTDYGSVVGSTATASIPTTLALSVAAGKEVSWTANNTDSYQPQSSTDGISWNNLGPVLIGSAVSSVYDPAPVAFYQVLDYTVGGVTNVEPNGSFEIPDVNSTGALDWSGPANGVDANGNILAEYVTNSWGTLTPVDGTNLLYMEATTPATGPVTPPNMFLNSALFPIPAGGVTYPLSFSSANPVTIGGANPQYQIEYWDINQAFVSATAFNSIGAGASWTTISNNLVAPANAAYISINFIQAMGAGNGWDWVTLIDNIDVAAAIPGPTNVLAATVQSGAVFTAAVLTNGVAAGDASGTVFFQTNSVGQSSGVVAAGVAHSAPAVVPASYLLTAIYSGDGTYLGSTNSLMVGSGTSNNPTNLTYSVSANQLTISWPADHLGWFLQSQTNKLNIGLTTNWVDVPGSGSITQSVMNIDRTKPTVFFRLRSP
jgi:hypothetical protein